MTGLPPLQVFSDVPVVPVTAVHQHIARGGPVWPAFDHQIAARHCRDGLPVDHCPAAPETDRAEVVQEPAVWGGFLNLQFGHLIVEQLTRLPQALRARPDDLVLFTLPPGTTPDTLPDWVWQVLDWHGVARHRVRLVERPLQMRQLAVAAQGEMMGNAPTAAAYLDLLDRNMTEQALAPDPADVLFVTRAGLVARGQGGHAGEGYLAGVLQHLGMRVIDPAALPVRAQLAAYAGAGVLVFAEGAALQGRMLLGRLAQDIHVLRRRPNRDLAAAQLRPRCRDLQYHAAVRHRFGARKPGGANRLDLTAAIYDLDTVFAVFAGLGYDPAPLWDPAAYHAAVRGDLRGWISGCKTDAEQLKTNLDLARAAGFDLDFPIPVPPRKPQRQPSARL